MQKYSMFHDLQEPLMKRWHSPYADLLQPYGTVLDIGCGLGYFADLLRERGTACLGIDIDPEMVRATQQRGHTAVLGDDKSVESLTDLFGSIHLSHVIEHLWGDEAVRLLEICSTKLNANGLLVIRTPNWGNQYVRSHNFWLDHTHKRPYPHELLCKILTDNGLSIIEAGAEPYGLNDLFVVARKISCPENDSPKLIFGADPFSPPPRPSLRPQTRRSVGDLVRRIYRGIARRL